MAIEFNSDKCEMLDFGKTNLGRICTITDRALGSVAEPRGAGTYFLEMMTGW